MTKTVFVYGLNNEADGRLPLVRELGCLGGGQNLGDIPYTDSDVQTFTACIADEDVKFVINGDGDETPNLLLFCIPASKLDDDIDAIAQQWQALKEQYQEIPACVVVTGFQLRGMGDLSRFRGDTESSYKSKLKRLEEAVDATEKTVVTSVKDRLNIHPSHSSSSTAVQSDEPHLMGVIKQKLGLTALHADCETGSMPNLGGGSGSRGSVQSGGVGNGGRRCGFFDSNKWYLAAAVAGGVGSMALTAGLIAALVVGGMTLPIVALMAAGALLLTADISLVAGKSYSPCCGA
ncbi:MAG: hypothetical protein CMF50_08005 [Legionellales bacterium]|nr:hypothetical protein [Legionellales bacterium]|tara:strand:+ start:2628 stop:3500 length:873 start_codon:yes stop_codon:yes gene_type:complete